MKSFKKVVNVETGEVYDDVKVLTKSDIERCKKIFEAKELYEIKGHSIKAKYKENGSFVWLLYNAGKVLDLGISPNNLTKLIFISTFMDYDNRLMLKETKIMTKEIMFLILGVSKRTFDSFWNAITDAGLVIVKETGELFLNADVFQRGSTQTEDADRIRLYRKSIRSLYSRATVGEHKLLSYLFQAIPFVNTQYNMLCHNPTEKDLDLVKPMHMVDYCEIIGYSPENYRRLKTLLKKLTLKKKVVFSFVDNAKGLFCYVNPNVYYAGNDWERVEILGEFCK